MALFASTGSDRAFWEIVRRNQPKILQYFRRNDVTASLAEDLTQEVFIRIFRNASSYDPKKKFSTWSITITENIAKNAARTAKRNRVAAVSDLGRAGDAREDCDPLDPADADELPDSRTARSEARAILSAALEHIEPRYREPLVLHYVHGLSHTEAAHRLGIPVGTVKSRTHHAIKDLRNWLSDQGFAAAFT